MVYLHHRFLIQLRKVVFYAIIETQKRLSFNVAVYFALYFNASMMYSTNSSLARLFNPVYL